MNPVPLVPRQCSRCNNFVGPTIPPLVNAPQLPRTKSICWICAWAYLNHEIELNNNLLGSVIVPWFGGQPLSVRTYSCNPTCTIHQNEDGRYWPSRAWPCGCIQRCGVCAWDWAERGTLPSCATCDVILDYLWEIPDFPDGQTWLDYEATPLCMGSALISFYYELDEAGEAEIAEMEANNTEMILHRRDAV